MVNQTDEATDAQVVAFVLKGDKDMYATLVTRYETKLLRYAVYLLKDPDMAADVVQESFIKAYINLYNFHRDRSFSSWIYRIVHNEAMNLIKHNKKTATFTELDTDDNDYFESFKTDQLIDKKMLATSVRQCLQQLDVKYKEVLALYYFDHLDYNEISEVLHMPTSTVGVRLRRAKKMLKNVCHDAGVMYE